MTQVNREHYGFANVKPSRFQLYYHIIRTVYDLELYDILEVGIGAGIVTHTLRFNGRRVVTADVDEALEPDVVGDVRELPLEHDSFDVVVASEVLEHIPFKDVPKALSEIKLVTRKYALISVPYNQHRVSCQLDLTILRYLYFGGRINRFITRAFPIHLYFGVSKRWTDFVFDREHYWEIGYKGYSMRDVQSVLREQFVIERDFRVPLSPYQYVFLLSLQNEAKANSV